MTSTRFVGRTRELAELEAAWRDASAARPSLAFIAGESGVGKTRLVAELERRVRELGGRVIGGDCVELGEGELPYAPIVAALRPLAGDRDPALSSLPPAARTALARLLPSLGEAGEAGGHDDNAQGRLFEALLALVGRLAEERPLLVTVEDVHWADRSTRGFLTFLARSLCNERVLVVATYRSDELHRRHPLRPLLAELERDARARRVELAPFTREELADALTDILGAPPAPELVDRLFTRTEGNPLYTEELLAASLDGRAPLPPTLRDALMLRIERLGDPAQELLRVLAVGQRVAHPTLAGASGLEPQELRAALREAAAATIVVTDPHGRYAFRHALLREVVVDDLLPGEHAELHLALARALERRVASEGAGVHLSAGIAHHYTEAGERPAALAASIRAAAAAERVHAYGEAAALLERVLELWDRVPEAEGLAGDDHAAVLTRAADAHVLHGHRVRAEALLNAALAEVDEDADPLRAAALLERLSRTQWSLNRTQEALASGRRAFALLPDEPTAEGAHLHALWAKTRMLQGRYREAVDEAQRALVVADAAGDRSAASGALNALGISLMQLGETERGAACLRDAKDAARAADRLGDLGSAYFNLAEGYHLVGRTADALEIARDGRHAVEGLLYSQQWFDTGIAEFSFDAGDWETAFALLPSPRRNTGSLHVYVDLRRAEHALARAEHEDAAAVLDLIEARIEGSTEPQVLVPLGVLQAELHRRKGDLDAAADIVDVALDRIEFCTEDVSRVARMAAAGVTIEADRAERARDLGEDELAVRAADRAEELGLRVESAADEHRPVERALQATALADLARARGADDPAAWAAAAAAWAAVGRPYPAALAQARMAAAHVAAGDREAAVEPARAALETARRLGAAWLEGETTGLAARARLRLDDAAEGAGDEAGAGEDGDPFGLTPRERQVLALVAEGRTNREIGLELYMAEKTASVHVSRILAKLGVRGRTEAAAVAHRLGLDAERA